MRTNSQNNSVNAALAHQQRQAVKEIASSLQADLDAYERIPLITGNVEKIVQLRSRLIEKNQQLVTLASRGLDTTTPASTLGGKFKTGIALSGGAAARAGALTAATVTGVVQSGVMVVAAPVMGAAGGAINGFSKGWRAPVYCAKPVTAIAGMGIGTATGAIAGTLTSFVAIPVAIAIKGSIPRKTFSLIDQLPRARAYAKRKMQSTDLMARAANQTIHNLLDKVEEKRFEAEQVASAPARLRAMRADLHEMAMDY
ncbi:MAG: hypothetical protein V4695_08400 [Pseudomonadota bacterium]